MYIHIDNHLYHQIIYIYIYNIYYKHIHTGKTIYADMRTPKNWRERCVCMKIWLDVCMHGKSCVCACTHVYLCVCVPVCVCCIHVHMAWCMFAWENHRCLSAWVHVCKYIRMYTYLCIHARLYMHAYMNAIPRALFCCIHVHMAWCMYAWEIIVVWVHVYECIC